MKMLSNNVLVEKLAKPQISSIVMPDTVKEEWHRGKVIAVGSEVETIKEGDIVIYLAPPSHVGEFPAVDALGRIVITSHYICAIED